MLFAPHFITLLYSLYCCAAALIHMAHEMEMEMEMKMCFKVFKIPSANDELLSKQSRDDDDNDNDNDDDKNTQN